MAATLAQSPLLASSNSDSYFTYILASLTLGCRFTFPGELTEQLESSLRLAQAVGESRGVSKREEFSVLSQGSHSICLFYIPVNRYDVYSHCTVCPDPTSHQALYLFSFVSVFSLVPPCLPPKPIPHATSGLIHVPLGG